MMPQRIRFILIVLAALLIGYTVGVTKVNWEWKNFRPHVQVINKEPPPSLMTADFSQFWTVLSKIETNYYDKKAIDSQKLLNGAIMGMVESLDDPYTVYLPPKENTDFKQSLAGQFEGIGAELSIKEQQIIVVAPLDGSPAERAGVKAGDAILKVNDESIAGWTLQEAVDKIRGPKGTEVKLAVLHKYDTKPTDVKIIRDTIQVKSLVSWTKSVKEIDAINSKSASFSGQLDDKVTYIRLSQFGDTANKEWTDVAIKLNQELQQQKDVRGIILDLRNNPGGYLTDAVYIASEFVKDGTAVMQENKNGEREAFAVSGRGMLTNMPVVVLLNGGSASASEIVAGALRDHKRAEIVGEKSFGKGTIQEAEDLGGGAGLHVTIAKWLTPNGTWVHKEGLQPDYVISLDPGDPARDTQLEKAVEVLVK
ncbi:MAG TPA: S41 family peptidase [Patescibacteria group bacterium]|nr:S41 family peptidase [Patescibacteria group bacterium]